MGRRPRKRRGRALGATGSPAACARIDRGWSTLLAPIRRRCRAATASATSAPTSPSATGSWRRRRRARRPRARRRSAFVRRASFEGARAVAHTLAANIDVVFLCHSFAVAPNQRRLERELVLAFDSGADPVVLLTKSDLVDDPEPARRELQEVALGVPVLVSSGRSRQRARRAARDARGGTNGGVPRGQRRRQVDARQRPPRRAAPGDDRGRAAITAAATPPSPPSCSPCPTTAAG